MMEINPHIAQWTRWFLTISTSGVYKDSRQAARDVEDLFDEGNDPVEWKRANVVPTLKKDKKQVALNYRPVTVASVVYKVLEKIK